MIWYDFMYFFLLLHTFVFFIHLLLEKWEDGKNIPIGFPQQTCLKLELEQNINGQKDKKTESQEPQVLAVPTLWIPE